MEVLYEHLLSLIIFVPALGALVLLLPPFRDNDDAVRWVANAFALLGFVVSLPLWFAFDRAAESFQFREEAAWIPSIGVSYKLGVDGISALLVLLTTLLGVIAVLSSWTAITERVRQYYIFLLLLQTGMLGVFCALDMFLFYVFWEVMLVPMYFLIGIWGGARRLYAAIKFFLYTLVGSVVMLLGLLAVYFRTRTVPGLEQTGSFDYERWYALALQPDLQFWVFLAFFLGFAIKVPMFPVHTWLPDAHVEAPTAGSVTLDTDGTFVYTPKFRYGEYPLDKTLVVTFQYLAFDAASQLCSDPTTVTVTISGFSDVAGEPPTASPDAFPNADTTPNSSARLFNNGVLTVPAPGVLANDFNNFSSKKTTNIL